MARPEDVFEIEEEDLLGRLGRLWTKSGWVETPTLAPVVNPIKNAVPPREIRWLGFGIIMTNSYIIWRHYGALATEMGVHRLLGVEGPVMTDSGAYQILVYGSVEVDPLEIVKYQVELGSDIGVILDIPTRHDTPAEVVREEVEETIRRAREALGVERGDMLLVLSLIHI